MALRFCRNALSLPRRVLRTLFQRRRLDREMEDEFRFHMAMSAEKRIADGVPAAQAAREARAEFGNTATFTDSAREIRRAMSLERFGQDLHGGLRAARRAPAVTLAAIAMLGLGIGSTTTMFSITHGLLRDLPTAEPERIVHIAARHRLQSLTETRISGREFHDVRTATRTIEDLAAYAPASYALGDEERSAVRWSGAAITPNVFGVLGVETALGRAFNEDDALPGAPPVVVLGATLWRQRYQGDRAVVGRELRIDGATRTIVGVMRDGFRFPIAEELWIPATPDAHAPRGDEPGWVTFGRVRPGHSVEAAAAEVRDIGARAGIDPDRHIFARPYKDLLVPPRARLIARAMVVVVSFVLLIACANVAGLLLAQNAARKRELAVRSALGATPNRLTVQLVSEVLVLATGGGLVGLALAAAGARLFNTMAGFELAYWMSVRIDATVFACAAALVGASALLAGIAPARNAARSSIGAGLRDASRGSSGHGRTRLGHALVGFEVALSCVLLVVTLLMVQGVRLTVDALPHVRPEEIHVANVALRLDAYPDAAARRRFFSALQAAVAERAAPAPVALASAVPGLGTPLETVAPEGSADPRSETGVEVVSVTNTFFTMFAATLVEGRAFAPADDERAPGVAIVTRRFAERVYPGRSPVGERIRVGPPGMVHPARTIVGVVSSIDRRHSPAPGPGTVYVPLEQSGEIAISVMVRDAAPAFEFAPAVAEVVRNLDPDAAIGTSGRLADLLARESSSERLFGGLFLAFGAGALLLASIGLGSLVAFTARQRSREFGIRIALGAPPSEIAQLVLSGGARPLGLGLTAGLALATMVAPVLGAALMGADPRDWRVYAIAGVTLLVAGAAAAWMPARRALRVAPSEVLRAE